MFVKVLWLVIFPFHCKNFSQNLQTIISCRHIVGGMEELTFTFKLNYALTISKCPS